MEETYILLVFCQNFLFPRYHQISMFVEPYKPVTVILMSFCLHEVTDFFSVPHDLIRTCHS